MPARFDKLLHLRMTAADVALLKRLTRKRRVSTGAELVRVLIHEEARRHGLTAPLSPHERWALWTDGKAHRLRQGADFTCTVSTFRTQVAKRGKALRRRASVRVLGPGQVAVQFDKL